MSAECSSCGETCREPDEVWYAGTRFDWNVWWVCGRCVATIPADKRHPTDRLMEFEVTFGPLKCETNGRGVYQGLTSKQKTPQFWVRNDVLAKYCPGGEDWVGRFSPFNELESHLRWFANGVRCGELPTDGGRNKLLRDLTLLGPVVERFLHGPGPLQRQSVLPMDLEDLTPAQREAAEQLLGEVLAKYQ